MDINLAVYRSSFVRVSLAIVMSRGEKRATGSMAKLIRRAIPKGAIDEFVTPSPLRPRFFFSLFFLAFDSNSNSLTTFKPFSFLVMYL